jgi:hypothetical protein
MQQIALLIRYLTSRAPKYNFEADCMGTSNNFGFTQTPRFKFAEKKAIEARLDKGSIKAYHSGSIKALLRLY